MTTTRLLLTSITLFCFISLHAQEDLSPKTWHFIDTSIAGDQNLGDLEKTVNKLYQKAWAEKKYFQAGRCIAYLVRITDKRTDDTLYFKNSDILDDLLVQHEPQPAAFKYVLHMLKAKRLVYFISRYNVYYWKKYERNDIPVNYAAYTSDQLDSIADIHFKIARSLAKELNPAEMEDALWLSSQPMQFLFKPGFDDIAIAEQIAAVPRRYFNSALVFLKNWIDLSQEEFIVKLDSAAGIYKGFYSEFRHYRDWIAMHANDPSISFFIETLARKYVFQLLDEDKQIGKSYEKYLLQLTRSPYDPVRAHSIYQLFFMWLSQANNYFPGGAREYDREKATYLVDKSDYDTAYRYHAAKALKLFDDNRTVFDSFFYYKDILLKTETAVRSSSIDLTMQEYNLPNEPLLAELKYRSTDTLHYRLVKLKQKDESDDMKFVEEMPYLLKQPAWKDVVVPLPATNDFNFHNTYLQLDPLPNGRYAILLSPGSFDDTLSEKEYFYFDVTRIAAINSDKRVYILDRKTGKPLSGAKVKAIYEKKDKNNAVIGRQSTDYTVNSRGFIDVVNRKYDILEISHGADSLTESTSYLDEDSDDDGYTNSVDDLISYYVGNATAYVFTDRSIYRPGQTVHFKGIFVTKNKETGQPLLMSKENLKGKLFGSIYEKWLGKENPILHINDPFENQADSIKIIPNEYGSVSGSFKIPKTAATGEWNFEADDISVHWMGRTFRVEEYKRPSYEIEIEDPVKEIKLKDEFSFKVKVRSFAGAELSGVRINYKIVREGHGFGYDRIILDKMIRTDTIMKGSGFTDKDGMLEVVIKDTMVTAYKYDKSQWWNYNYSIDAEAIDANGESYEANSDIRISSNPVSISFPFLRSIYQRSSIKPVPIMTEDENAGSVSKKIQVKVFRRERTVRLSSDRSLTKADCWLYDQQALQNKFPLEKIIVQEEKESRELVWEKIIVTNDSSELALDPKMFPAGEYELEATCEENGSVAGTEKESFSVFDDKEQKLPVDSWGFYHTAVSDAKPGEKLDYYYGNSVEGTYSVFEIGYFAKGKKLTTRYIYEEQQAPKGLQHRSFAIPGNATDKVVITHLYILNNQLFTNEENITVEADPEPEPEIIVERYRKKLTPGSKETFTVSVKTKKLNTVAELMTTMYDASLDKLEVHNWYKPDLSADALYLNNEWQGEINAEVNSRGNTFGRLYMGSILANQRSDRPSLWWIQPGGEVDEYYRRSLIRGGSWKNTGRYLSTLDFDDMPSPYRGNNFQHDMNADVRWGDDTYGFVSTTAVPFLRIGSGDYEWGGFAANKSSDLLLARTSIRGFYYENNLDLNYNYSPSANFNYILPGHASLFGIRTQLQFGDLFLTQSKITENSEFFIVGEVAKKVTDQLPKGVRAYSTLESLEAYKQPLIILDGVIYTGDIKDIDVKKIKSGLVMKGGEAVALFGSKAADGVLVLSTEGYLELFTEEEPVIVPRKNFNELAFFFPAIYADKDGYYSFEFTMPETVTKWNWKMMAHTKNALFAYAERELNTQLPLMVQPNMPRLLYRGDRIVLQSRITNLDTVNNTGKIICKVEDAVTGDDITSKTTIVQQNNFSLEKKGNTSSPFEIRVPADQQNPLKITVTVRSANFADGEEHIIPVLSPKIFVKENRSFYFKERNDTLVRFDKLPADAEMYGVGVSVRPKPEAALIYSLPYLATYPYGCAEQIFNKLLAYATACKLMRDNEEVQRSFEEAKKVVEKENTGKEKLPGELSSETMPWLDLADHTSSMQQKLFNLLDTSRSKPVIDELLAKLHKMQNSDGGLSWFPGGKNNFYISCYVLRSFGKLAKDDQLVTEDLYSAKQKNFIKKLVEYADWAFTARMKANDNSYLLYYAYARSYWLNEYSLEDSLETKIRTELIDRLKQWTSIRSLYTKALLITTALRYAKDAKDELNLLAYAQLRSIRQAAIEDEENGIRWKELSDNEDLSNAAEETVALLAEAFSEGKYPDKKDQFDDVNRKMIKWLMTAKSEHNWRSTKATAAAINMLQQKENIPPSINEKQLVKLKLDNKTVSASNDLLSGSGFDFIRTNTVADLSLQKENAGPAIGNVYRYYFTSMLQPELLNKDVQLKKEFFKWNEKENKWEALKTGDVLKIADKIKVTISIHTLKTLQYVFIDDKRAALFEPMVNNSGYEYEGGLDYYKSVRDAGFQFFFDAIAPGDHAINYEVKVAQEGSFFSGPAVLQCMYKPELTAYSNSEKFSSAKN